MMCSDRLKRRFTQPLRSGVSMICIATALIACSGDDRPFEESIEASEGNIASLEVTALDGVITPVVVGVGERLRFTANAINPAGVVTEFDTTDRSWSVSDSSVASIDRDGVLTGRANGTVDVELDFGVITARPLTISVSSANLVEISQINGVQEPEACLDTEYSAVGAFDDGTQRVLSAVTWSLSNDSNAELISEAGDSLGRIRVVPFGLGMITLTAESNGFSLSRELSVAENLVDLSFPPGLRSVTEGDTISLTATATYLRNNVETLVDVTDSVQWSVTDESGSATITNAALDRGVLTGTEAGAVTVTATCGAISTTQTVQVLQQDDDDGLAFASGSTRTIALANGGVQLAVSTGSTYDSDNDVSDSVTWSSLNADVLAVDPMGFITPLTTGTATVQVSLEGETATLVVTVN